VTLLARQHVRGTALGLGPYVLLTLAVAVTLLALRNTLQVISAGYLTVLFEPFVTPVVAVSVLVGLYLALVTGLGVARERELGTLETLFYGPITPRAYLLGKLLGAGLLYVVVIGLYLASCAALAMTARLVFSPSLFAVAALGLPATLALVCLSLVCAATTRTVRGTLLLFLGVAVVLGALQGGQTLLVSIVSDSRFLDLVALRDTMSLLSGALRWVSPFAYTMDGTQAVLRADITAWALDVALACAYTLVGLHIAAGVLGQKGVLR